MFATVRLHLDRVKSTTERTGPELHTALLGLLEIRIDDQDVVSRGSLQPEMTARSEFQTGSRQTEAIVACDLYRYFTGFFCCIFALL